MWMLGKFGDFFVLSRHFPLPLDWAKSIPKVSWWFEVSGQAQDLRAQNHKLELMCHFTPFHCAKKTTKISSRFLVIPQGFSMLLL